MLSLLVVPFVLAIVFWVLTAYLVWTPLTEWLQGWLFGRGFMASVAEWAAGYGLKGLREGIPALLALSAIHHHLVRAGLRTTAGLVVETGFAREVHHFAVLAGYGAEAIHPYLALETLVERFRDAPGEVTAEKAVYNYIKAIGKGLSKIMSKMGISTYMSYCGAQIFEAVGLNRDLVDKYFRGTASNVGGMGLFEVMEEAVRAHRAAFSDDPVLATMLDAGGEYQWRVRGEEHMWTPDAIAKLQHSTRANSYQTYKEYAQIINDQSRRHLTLRGLFEFRVVPSRAIALDEVEPVPVRFHRRRQQCGEEHVGVAGVRVQLVGRPVEAKHALRALDAGAHEHDVVSALGVIVRLATVPHQDIVSIRIQIVLERGPVVALQEVECAPAALDPVVAVVTEDRVVAVAAVDEVIAGSGEGLGQVVAADDVVLTRSALVEVAAEALARRQGVVARPALEGVVPEVAEQDVVAQAADQIVVTVVSVHPVVAVVAPDGVVAFALP